MPDAGELEFIIISTNQNNCELISYYLKKEFDATCVCSDSLQRVAPENKKKPAGSSGPIYLIDCMGLSASAIERQLHVIGCNSHEFGHPTLVLFHVEPNLKIKSLVSRYKILCVFKSSDSPEVLCQGLKAIGKGQQWFLSKLLSEGKTRVKQPDLDSSKIPELSNRQKSILKLMAAGASNHEIAEKLSISTHTVKTHIYNIYRKFNVSNRIQAAFFANDTSYDDQTRS